MMFNHIISLENLLEAWKEFLKGKRSKKSIKSPESLAKIVTAHIRIKYKRPTD